MKRKIKLIVSACLLGECCRYDGASKPCAEVIALADIAEFLPVCPERDGGLPTPRPPAEISGFKVVNSEGGEVTEQYIKGAQLALRKSKLNGATLACLKERSPSCGCREIYDGSFSGKLIPGMGITAKMLTENGVRVFGETETDELRREAEMIKN